MKKKLSARNRRTVLITGANIGIGKNIAKHFAKNGDFVILTGKNKSRLAKVHKEIEERGQAVLSFPADLSKVEEVRKLVSKIKRKVRRIDIIVNVAGIYHDGKKAFYNIDFENYTLKQVLDTHNVGFTAPTILCHKLLPLMRKDSKIINISGTFENGAKGWLPYYSSKKALEDFTVGLSQELKDKQIQVNCISPADTLTESYKRFFPQYANPKECLDPQDIAKLAWFLASDQAQHITGQIIEIRKGKEK